MGDVLVENQAGLPVPPRKNLVSTIPAIEKFEGLQMDGNDEYAELKKLQRQKEYVPTLLFSVIMLCRKKPKQPR